MMKKKYAIYFILCIFMLFAPNIAQAAECRYQLYECTEADVGYLHRANLDHSLAPYCQKHAEYTLKLNGSSGSIYKGDKKEGAHGHFGGDEELQNWSSSSCPNYVAVNVEGLAGLQYVWYGYDDLSSAENKLKTAKVAMDGALFIEENVLAELKNEAEEFDMNVAKTCPYTKKVGASERTFEIDFNKDGYAIAARSTEETGIYTEYNYTISSSMRSVPQLEPGVCENVYVELENTVRIPTEIGSYNYYFYIIYNDSGDCVEQGGDCDDTDGSVSSDEGDNATCKTYEAKFKEYSTNYASCIDGNVNGQCEAATNMEIKLNVSCQNIFKKQTYGDECLKFCLDLDRKIAVVKQTSAKDYNQSQCGFSARLINWIMKIIKWIRYIVPILLIVLSVMDFIKAVSSDSEDEMRKVGAKFVKRLIVAALIFVLPLLLDFLLGIFGIPVKDFCV